MSTEMRTTSASLPAVFYTGAALVLALGYLTANPSLTVAALLTLFALTRILWRSGEPPAMLMAVGFQWIQISTPILQANLAGTPIEAQTRSGDIEQAIWLSLGGLLALGLGMRFALARFVGISHANMDAQLRRYSINRLFAAYFIATLFSAALPYFAWRVLSLTQLFVILGSIKWVFYMLLGYVTLRQRRQRELFAVATVIEFVEGIGFFSEFKTVFIVCALVVASLHVRLTVRGVIATGAVAITVFIASLGWMSIREDYRRFLNQGTGQQVVLVSPVEQLSTFSDLVGTLDAQRLNSSVGLMMQRLSYVEYFAAVLDYVPAKRAYENGTLLLQAIEHVLVPRFLYPSKAALEADSDVSMRYTGLLLPSTAEGTSISLGYMAEAYIDFGPYLMFASLFMYGMLWGSMYRWFNARKAMPAFGVAFGAVLFLSAAQFETAQAKLLGGMLSRFLLFAVFLRYSVPSIDGWLSRQAKQKGNELRPAPAAFSA